MKLLEKIRRIVRFYLFDAVIGFSGTHTPAFSEVPAKLEYEQYWKSRSPKKLSMNLRHREKVVTEYVTEGSRVMDFGCGVSNVLLALKKKKYCEVIGFDISKRAILIQKREGVPAFMIQKKNYLKKGHFDYVILTEVLEHMSNPEILIEEIKSLTNNLIISIPNYGYFAYRLKLLFQGRISMGWMYHPGEHLRFWTHVEFIEWMEARGCKLKSFQCVEGILSSFNIRPNLLSWDIVYVFST